MCHLKATNVHVARTNVSVYASRLCARFTAEVAGPKSYSADRFRGLGRRRLFLGAHPLTSVDQRDPADQHLISQSVLDYSDGRCHRVDGNVEVDGNLLG